MRSIMIKQLIALSLVLTAVFSLSPALALERP
jgi:hypothetical protein